MFVFACIPADATVVLIALCNGTGTMFAGSTYRLIDGDQQTTALDPGAQVFDFSIGALLGGAGARAAGGLADDAVRIRHAPRAAGTTIAPSLTSRAPQVLRVGDVKLSAVPKGAVGTPTQTGNGLQYSIKSGTPELDPRVTHVRIMDPVTTGKYQYPNGYAAYMNRSGQTVNPLTGETISNSHPFAHIPL